MNYISIELLKNRVLGEEIIKYFSFIICTPCQNGILSIYKVKYLQKHDITFSLHSIPLLLCNIYQCSLVKKFCCCFCFLSKHNIYHYLCSWIYKLLGNSGGETYLCFYEELILYNASVVVASLSPLAITLSVLY